MALDALTQSITNWDEFSTANGYYWNSSTPTCLWKGVTCSGAGRVVSLSLECNRCPVQAEGSLPAELTQLTAVQLLNFQGNAFNSSLPEEWGANQTFPALQTLYATGGRAIAVCGCWRLCVGSHYLVVCTPLD